MRKQVKASQRLEAVEAPPNREFRKGNELGFSKRSDRLARRQDRNAAKRSRGSVRNGSISEDKLSSTRTIIVVRHNEEDSVSSEITESTDGSTLEEDDQTESTLSSTETATNHTYSGSSSFSIVEPMPSFVDEDSDSGFTSKIVDGQYNRHLAEMGEAMTTALGYYRDSMFSALRQSSDKVIGGCVSGPPCGAVDGANNFTNNGSQSWLRTYRAC